MQPEFHSGAVCGHTPALRHIAAGDDGLPCAAGPRGACCWRVCARAGVGSRWVVLRWGARVVGGLWHRGEGAIVWCLVTPSSRAPARKGVSMGLPFSDRVVLASVYTASFLRRYLCLCLCAVACAHDVASLYDSAHLLRPEYMQHVLSGD